jgi:hypothetical protein
MTLALADAFLMVFLRKDEIIFSFLLEEEK